jgi:hypothetical protein
MRNHELTIKVSSSKLKNANVLVSADENSLGNVILLTRNKVIEIIESSYPNPVTIQDIAK